MVAYKFIRNFEQRSSNRYCLMNGQMIWGTKSNMEIATRKVVEYLPWREIRKDGLTAVKRVVGSNNVTKSTTTSNDEAITAEITYAQKSGRELLAILHVTCQEVKAKKWSAIFRRTSSISKPFLMDSQTNVAPFLNNEITRWWRQTMTTFDKEQPSHSYYMLQRLIKHAWERS